jgi:hypothetical protein
MTKGWKRESERHKLSRNGIRTTDYENIKLSEKQVIKRWKFVIDKLNMRYDINEDTGLDDVYYTIVDDDDMPTIDFEMTIENPAYKIYDGDLPKDVENEMDTYLRKTYPKISFDNSHLKNEEYLHVRFSPEILPSEVDQLYALRNNPTTLDREWTSKFEQWYHESGANTFRNDFLIYTSGSHDLNKIAERKY